MGSALRLTTADSTTYGLTAPIAALAAEPPGCKCLHRRSADGRCHRRAAVRVSLTCRAEGCDCAAGVYLLCRPCLREWRLNAQEDGTVLRVRDL